MFFSPRKSRFLLEGRRVSPGLEHAVFIGEGCVTKWTEGGGYCSPAALGFFGIIRAFLSISGGGRVWDITSIFGVLSGGFGCFEFSLGF